MARTGTDPDSLLVTHVPEEGRAPSTAVVEAVGSVSDTPVTELPPLYDVLDAEALDALVSAPGAVDVRFHYAGYVVSVHGDGVVDVYPGPDG